MITIHFSRWENDQQIRHLAQPHGTQADLTKQHRVTIDRLSHQLITPHGDLFNRC